MEPTSNPVASANPPSEHLVLPPHREQKLPVLTAEEIADAVNAVIDDMHDRLQDGRLDLHDVAYLINRIIDGVRHWAGFTFSEEEAKEAVLLVFENALDRLLEGREDKEDLKVLAMSLAPLVLEGISMLDEVVDGAKKSSGNFREWWGERFQSGKKA